MATNETKISVTEIIVNRIIEKIEKEKQLPWQKPFLFPSLNWYTKTEYRGINKLLLYGGEYISASQLKKYNAKNKINYWFDKGTPYEIVFYFSYTDRALNQNEIKEYKLKGQKAFKFTIVKKDDTYFERKWFKKYSRVYDIKYIHDDKGNTLTPLLGAQVIDVHTNPNEIVYNYISQQNIKILNQGNNAYYILGKDTVVIPHLNHFKSDEYYYRTLFHELIHSTGEPYRLDRKTIVEYNKDVAIRSKEELVAEMGSLLLASEAGFKEGTAAEANSDNYLLSWLEWINNNKKDIISCMTQAERAKNFILGKDLDSYNSDLSSKKIK
ncbi:zincin-like metallopeptidase domain-containing protein [Clostridioides sp. ZZV15-6597]|uniref:zincin-like metallopeptidase domain-containing protein n=1 Tax=Clostridioides sp. ZZV15-6597 TaxID=2811500 RepID=UPI001D1248A2|nr:DUF1738 domain-containing protein [Clostridioides sp. ZZV15-6597]